MGGIEFICPGAPGFVFGELFLSPFDHDHPAALGISDRPSDVAGGTHAARYEIRDAFAAELSRYPAGRVMRVSPARAGRMEGVGSDAVADPFA